MPSPTTNTPPQRLPAPSLFIAPPSRNTSTLDLPLHKSPTTTTPSHQQPKSPLSRSSTATIHITPSAAIPSPGSPIPDHPDAKLTAIGLRPPSPHSSNPSSPSLSLSSPPQNRSLPPPSSPDPPNDERTLRRRNLGVGEEKEDEAVVTNRARRPTAVLDAHWAALQSTLSDIELSASGTSHVFGPNHANALEDLRASQVALARAWGPRGEGEDEDGDLGGTGAAGTGLGSGLLYGSVRGKREEEREREKEGKGRGLERVETKNTTTTATTKTSGKTKGGSSEHGSGSGGDTASRGAFNSSEKQRKQSLAGGPAAVRGKEADADLDAAEQRRKESDAYFKRVKEGVEEVVRKLEGVSKAMRNVELESREIWGDVGSEEGSTELDDTSLMTRTLSPVLH